MKNPFSLKVLGTVGSLFKVDLHLTYKMLTDMEKLNSKKMLDGTGIE